MNGHHHHKPKSPLADQNVERLLNEAYQPEAPNAEFADRVRQVMQAAARKRRREASATRSKRPSTPTDWRTMAATALTIGVVLAAAVMALRSGRNVARHEVPAAPPSVTVVQSQTEAIAARGALTPRKAQPAPDVERLSIGKTVSTKRGERRRLSLPDGSTLYVNQNTSARLVANRRVRVDSGEVFVEVSPRDEGLETFGRHSGAVGRPHHNRRPPHNGRPHHNAERRPHHDPATFVVETPDREVTALGTKFSVGVDKAGTNVLVVQGKVKLDNLAQPLLAGERFMPKPAGAARTAPHVSAAPRASHLLDWTEPLMAAARSPLVPRSEYAGGSLTAVDPNGQETKFSLRKYRVDVHIEDGFARTTIDQTYFNHLDARLEGTFHFPLPPDASISRLAMYVGGKLMEGGMVERNHGRQVFESIKYRMLDPALLEWVDGSTFKMRVFPLEGRQEKRIVLSYTQRLESLYGRTRYRFPAGHSLEKIGRWSLHLRAKNLANADWSCDTHDMVAKRDGRDLVLESAATNVAADRDVVLDLISTYGTSGAEPRFSSARHEGSRYLMVRYRPRLDAGEVTARRLRRDWVFLFESSADRDPLLARAQVEIVRTLLDNAEHDDTFCIVTANTRPRQLGTSFNRWPNGPRVDAPQPSRGPLGQRLNEKATPANVAAAIDQLEQTHLLGALDLEQAFGAVGQIASDLDNPVIVHLGSGTPVLGERDETKLCGLLHETIQYVGIGVGKRWNRGLMKSLAARSGGYFTQINPDEAIGWQSFDLLATLNTSRLVNVQATDPAGRRRWLVFNDALADGEEFCVVTRVAGNQPLPKSVAVTGSLDGQPYGRELTVANVAPDADYLPRQWAKLEIDRLVADDAAEHRDEIIALSKSMYVMSPFTSLLVLENEAMYAQYHVDRGRKDHWAIYPCPDKIEVVYEPLPPAPTNLAHGETREKGNATSRDVLNTILGHAWPAIKLQDYTSELNDIDRGLIWLIQHQQGDGGWSLKHHAINHRGISAGGLLPPVDLWNGRAHFRVPGRINLNTVGDTWVWEAINAQETQTSGDELVPHFFGYARGRSDTADFDELIRLITSTMAPDTWEEVGGPGSVAEFETNLSLVVSQTWERDESAPEESISPAIMGGLRFDVNRPFGGGQDDPFNGIVDEPLFDPFSPDYLSDDVHYFPAASESRYGTTRGVRDFLAFEGVPDQQGRPYGALDLWIYDPYRNISSTGVGYSGFPLSTYQDAQLDGRAYFDLVGVPAILEEFERHKPIYGSTALRDSAVRDYPAMLENYALERDWVELELRRHKWTPSLDRVLQQLTIPTNVNYTDARLAKIIEELENSHGIKIELDSVALKRIGLDGESKVTVKFSQLPLREALEKLLNELHPSLTFVLVPHNSSLLITSREAAMQQHPLTRSLLAFAPGMTASLADVLAVLDREVSAGQQAHGSADPRARRLFAQSRHNGWRKFSPATGKNPSKSAGSVVAFDGQGRLRIDRTTADGLRETVICDDRALWHVYPELGVAARRAMSRFHRAAIAANLPWIVPPVEDLAIGADVRLAAERTVDVVPIEEVGGSGDPPTTSKPPTTREPAATEPAATEPAATEPATTTDGQPERVVKLRLVFAKDGSLRQRKWIEMPGDKVIVTMDLDEDGAITWTDGKGKTLGRAEIRLAETDEPDLEPRVENLAVLPMPLRTVEHLVTSSGLTMSGGDIKWTRDAQWTDEQATAAIAAASAQGNAKLAAEIMCYWFYDADRKDWQAAFYRFLPLLAGAGVDWAANVQRAVKQQLGRDWNPLEEFPDTPLGRFLVAADVADQPTDGFVQSLAEFRGLLVQLQTADADDDALRHKAVRFVVQVRSPRFAWAVLSRLQVDEHDTEAHQELAEAYAPLADVHAFSYVARYERAAHLHSAGSVEDAQKAFLNLLQETFDAGIVPPFDKRLPDAFDADDPFGGNPFADDNSFHDIIIRNARKLAERHATLPLVRLAWQCRWAGQAAVADELIELVRTDGADPRSEGRRDSRLTDWVRLGVLQYYWATEQPEPADAVLAELLDERQLAKLPNLWLLGAEIADRRGRLAEAADRHRKALDLAYGALEGRIDVEAVRRDFGALLGRYEKLARAIVHPSAEPPLHLVAAVIGAADRWRSLEVDVTDVCRRTAKILAVLGADPLAWDYATTPVAGRGTESAAWIKLAQSLADEDSLELADRAFQTAQEMEPTNADILWQHGQMLESKGRRDRAAELYRKIVDREWQPRFSGTKSRAQQRIQAKR